MVSRYAGKVPQNDRAVASRMQEQQPLSPLRRELLTLDRILKLEQ
jgi:hypothetical protein